MNDNILLRTVLTISLNIFPIWLKTPKYIIFPSTNNIITSGI